MDRQEMRQRIAQHPNAVTAAELFAMLEAYGWTLDRVRGSHHIYRKEGAAPFPIPVHGRTVKPVYVRHALTLTEGEDE
jgi:predicted RNA binding protein YcfA (HicA-like mRNA interferase family)